MEYPFSMLSNSNNPYDMPASSSSCLPQVDGFYGDYGMVLAGNDNNNKMGLEIERDLCLPALENNGNLIDVKSPSNNHFNNGCFSNTDHHQISSKVDLFGFGNHGQTGENLRMGEWDLEGLMQDISSFPFLDFQVE